MPRETAYYLGTHIFGKNMKKTKRMIDLSKSSGMEREGFGKRHPEESIRFYFLSCVGDTQMLTYYCFKLLIIYTPFFMHDAKKDKKISKRRQVLNLQ